MSQPSASDPNPNPALLLPPEIARQLQVASLVFAGTTAVLVWDILHHLVDDYRLLFEYKFRLATAAYFVSRIASLIYALGFSLFATYPIPNCQAAMIIFNCGLLFASSASSFLFFLRVRAVYGGRPLVTWIFGFLWVCVVGAAITVPIGTKAIKVGGSLCLVSKVPAYAGAAATVLMVNDTLVVLAISYRLLTNTHRDNAGVGERLRAFFSGANLHAYSMAVFRDGQKYYMITILSNTVTISLVYAAGVSAIYHGTMSIPNVALTSIMACRVYRNATLHPRPRGMSVELSATSNSRSGPRRISVPLNQSTDGQVSSVSDVDAWKAVPPAGDVAAGIPKSEPV
ncbi:hypothetical protein DFH08DRAFT_117890 [Mycena albidolilacea]|uniref:Uncharacterized protein n=1 Tax=Mycena albidolilacea TaxID=1033008 RepID=A0AAD7ETG3_9AGAR|nr:hypothetical protein DFH08DRAFT_117890 [Mycena albidolilacea]